VKWSWNYEPFKIDQYVDGGYVGTVFCGDKGKISYCVADGAGIIFISDAKSFADAKIEVEKYINLRQSGATIFD